MTGIATLFFGRFFVSVLFGSDSDGPAYLIFASGILDVLLAMMCVGVLVLRHKKSPDTVRLWLVMLASVAIYEIGMTLLALGSDTIGQYFLWPAITIYVFIRAYINAGKYTVER